MTANARLTKSCKLFEVRENIPLDGPLDGVTHFELLRVLCQQGWEWRVWLPPSRRPKRSDIVDSYVRGEPKRWHSSIASLPAKAYLVALLKSQAQA